MIVHVDEALVNDDWGRRWWRLGKIALTLPARLLHGLAVNWVENKRKPNREEFANSKN
jgi:hypothetical protein